MAEREGSGLLSGPLVTKSKGPPGLVDPWGRPVSEQDAAAFGPPSDPLRGANKEGRADVVYRDIPITTMTSWTIADIASALQSHMMGQFMASALLCDAITGDDRVQAALGSRTAGLFGQPIKFIAPSTDAKAMKVADAWKEAWPSFAPQAVLEELMGWATLIGFAIAEIQWNRDVTPWQPYLKPWHPMYAYYRWDLRKYVIVTLDGEEVIEPGNGRWFLFTPHGEFRGWRRGAVRALAQPWFKRQLSWRDWARYNERHGIPMIKAKMPARTDEPTRNKFISKLGTLGQESVVACPQNVDGTGYDVEMIEAKDRSWESFKGSMEMSNAAIVLTILWQNLTTEIQEGSYAAARIHGGVRQNAIQFDNATLTHSLLQQCARPFADWNFGDPGLATTTTWDVSPPEDKATTAKMLMDLAAAIGTLTQSNSPLDVEALLKEYGLPVRKGAAKKTAPMFKYHLDAGIPTVNEVRESLGLDPRPGGDVPTQASQPTGPGGEEA